MQPLTLTLCTYPDTVHLPPTTGRHSLLLGCSDLVCPQVLSMMNEYQMQVEMMQELLAVLRNLAHCIEGSAVLVKAGVPQVPV